MTSQTRQFDRTFNRLSPAILKKRAELFSGRAVSGRAAGESAQLLGQRSLILVVIKIGDVNQASSLLANRLHDSRMRVSQRIHAQARNKIEIAPVVEVVKKHALPPRQHNGIPVVSPQQIPPLQLRNLFKCFHRKIRFYRKTNGEMRGRNAEGVAQFELRISLGTRLRSVRSFAPPEERLRSG